MHKPGLSRLVALLKQCTNVQRNSVLRLAALMIVTAGSVGCGQSEQPDSRIVPAVSEAELRPGGNATTSLMPFPSFDKLAPSLPDMDKPDFHAGRALARQPWVKAPTITDARDGLGPVYNARACLACHVRGGKGLLPADSQTPLFSGLVKMSIPVKTGGDIEWLPEPTYGEQLQTQSVALQHQLRLSTPVDMVTAGQVAPEAYAYIQWQQHTFTYPDGTIVTLRQPSLDLQHLAYGDMHAETAFSLRNAPMIQGMGLLEMIPQEAIQALADPDDQDQDGISGRVNQVLDIRTGELAPGRFGLKANKASIDEIVAGAFANDLGISNPLFPEQPCTSAQIDCLKQPDGNGTAHEDSGFELPDHLLQLVIRFTNNLGVPKRRNADVADVQAGRSLFYQSGCASCHQPSFQTASAEQAVSPELTHLANQTIWPYTDLLLHDMGPGLADHRPDGDASGSEWRTAPLWGIGLSAQVNGSRNLLHDGRAQTIEEAILWHGGEASAVRQRFVALGSQQRQQLLAFVRSL